MNILGVAFLSDASACVLKDGKLVAAVSEERINRIKQWNGVPTQAVGMALDIAGLSLDDIDVVATHGLAPSQPDPAPFDAAEERILASVLPEKLKRTQVEILRNRQEHEARVLGQRTPEYIERVRKLGRPMKVYRHHESHAASAAYASGWDECVVLTADGWGEDGSATVYDYKDGEISLRARNETIDSLGYFYGAVTEALGFVPHRHEGKVLGLAAYCQAPESYGQIGSMVSYNSNTKVFCGHMENGVYIPRFQNPHLPAIVAKHDRTDIASAVQRRLEEVVTELVADLGDNNGKKLRIALAGGIFANVKLNQRIAQLDNVEEIFVFPNMGDGGLSVGAAYLAHVEATGAKPAPFNTALLGFEANEEQIVTALEYAGMSYERCTDIADRVAGLLADGQVVCRFDGAMEFGPRALGNRTIMYKASEPEVNDWLNRRLSRSEFMPFAPATLEEHMDECYLDVGMAREATKYMTVTLDCTDRMLADSPAAVHVDKTARPQMITKDQYPRFHDVLSAYYEKTGVPTVINTSFNMHEEPIVCTVDDALRAFKAGKLPYLAVGDYLVTNNDGLLV